MKMQLLFCIVYGFCSGYAFNVALERQEARIYVSLPMVALMEIPI